MVRLIAAAQVVKYFYGLILLNEEIKIKRSALKKTVIILNDTKKEYKVKPHVLSIAAIGGLSVSIFMSLWLAPVIYSGLFPAKAMKVRRH